MAVGSIAGALGYLGLGREAHKRDKIQLLRAIPTPFACATVAIKSSISFDALILNIILPAELESAVGGHQVQ